MREGTGGRGEGRREEGAAGDGRGRAETEGRTRDRNKLLTECEEKPKFTTEICYGVEQVCFLLIHYEVEINIF